MAKSMMEDPFATLVRVLLAVLVALGPSLYPALHLLDTINPLSSRTQRILLLPALALMISFVIAGWLVVILGAHSVAMHVAACAFLNGFVRLRRRRSVSALDESSPWERLERMIERGEIGDRRGLEETQRSSGEPEIEDEATEGEERADEGAVRDAMMARLTDLLDRLPEERILLAILGLLIVLMIPLFSQPEPLGIDWVGFSTLSHRFAAAGDASLPPPSIGRWTYPPAFPALAAILESTLFLEPQFAVHLLGQLSLLCVLLGAAGAMERFGAGLQTLLCSALAAGLFAKTIDSGYPTVASQLGLVIGLIVLVGPQTRRDPKRDMSLMITVGAIGAIHPTGSIALGTLLLAHVVAHLFEREGGVRRGGGMVAGTSVVLGMSAVVVLGIFAPRLLHQAIEAEYGWQGGLPLLLWNSPLIFLAGAAAWHLRHTMEGRIIALWISFQWAMASVHLFDGMVSFSLLTLLSYVLYSTALHGFHIPLACLAALALAPNARLTPCSRTLVLREDEEAAGSEDPDATDGLTDSAEPTGPSGVADGEEAPDDIEPYGSVSDSVRCHRLPSRPHERLTTILLVLVSMIATVSAAWLSTLGEHPELYARTAGDREIHFEANVPPDAMLYVESMPWGHPIGADPTLARTDYPNLGLIEVEDTFPNNLTWAMQTDSISHIAWHGVTHAISSPRGELGILLATSEHWELLLDIDGSRLWRFAETPTALSSLNSRFLFASQDQCGEGCLWRSDPWLPVDEWRTGAAPDDRPYLQSGGLSHDFELDHADRDRWVRVIALVEGADGHRITMVAGASNSTSTIEVAGNGRMQEVSLLVRSPSDGTMHAGIEVSGDSESWLNPMAVTGRGDRLVDGGGLWVHWIEVRPI